MDHRVLLLILTVLVASFARVVYAKSQRGNKPTSDTTMSTLRQKVLALTPKEIGVAPSIDNPHVWGVLMETGYPEAVASLVVLADGTTSLYFSTGGGVIGAGAHDNIWKASKRLLQESENYIPKFTAVKVSPMPAVGKVKFYLLTYTGILAAEAEENDLGEQRHELSSLFYLGQEVIAAIREAKLFPGDGPEN